VKKNSRQDGFTIIELLLVLVVVLVLAAIVAASFSSIRKRENNKERRSDIMLIQSNLENYYVKHTMYPTLDEVNNQKWRDENFKQISTDVLTDPTGSSDELTNKPAGGSYSYQVTGSDGKSCDNTKTICTEYTLTATLEGGGTFTRNNIN